MPSKKKKYNARFPAGRIKKIMQTDEDVGKVAQAVPVIISRTLELFVESLLTKSVEITNKRNAKTLSTSHVKQCILAESRFDFLKDLVKSIPDISHAEERESGQTMSADSSPNANRYVESANTFGDPGPSTAMRHPRRTHKKEDRQSSDSESDREPPAKRTAKNAFGNGRNLKVSANFDDELNAFKQRMNQTTNRKASAAPRIDMAGRSFTAPATVGLLSPGENNDGEGNKQRLPNFYTETLQDTPEDDEKERNADRPAYSSVIQPNPVYAGQKSSQSPFGFYKQVEQEAKCDVGTVPSYEKSPYIVSFGKNSDPQLPMYHIDLAPISEDRQVGNEPPFTPTLLSQPRTPLADFASSPNAKKTPPPLTILKRSFSMPENPVLNFSRPSRTGDPTLRHTAQNESKSRLERSSHSIDSSGSTAGSLRKNEPPLLLPINLVSKASIAPPSGAPLPSSRLEIDEDYDT